ncbi:NAD(P)/FAD-dependent oxidoreductase [Reichenbachiella versicolor]|uniref:NAD(P)/FAD-dependent oxidoreductase n=1 Tax=Reichenbachiella versicolor TaxID=1821036 RepID=UPI000D6EA815|nr:FAD/NAD(P)-binding oxidoreductase [Reichenbachiella versicolor]
MSTSTNDQTCVIIGASHAGVNFAFALRKEGWEGDIIIYDVDPVLPYHRPPLSKAYLTSDDGIEKNLLKSAESYEKESITLKLGSWVESIDREAKKVSLKDGEKQHYDKLVIATGARPIIPPIEGLADAQNVYPLRTAADVTNIRQAINEGAQKAVIIGAGYIGLEIAASMKKLGADVTVIEREDRVLARVTSPEMSSFFETLHADNGVKIEVGKTVNKIKAGDSGNLVITNDDKEYKADVIVVGVGIKVNTELAKEAGIEIDNGIKVDSSARTSDPHIYAIGDCTYHHNPHYNRYVRLESVQNAVDQAKIAAASICGKEVKYDAIPWFWSDQFDVKLQMVGLAEGYDEILIREENTEGYKFSTWYFKGDELLAVDAVNNAKAYVVGTKFIKDQKVIDKTKLVDSSIDFKPANLLAE